MKLRKPTKKEYGQTALVGLLGGYLVGGIIGSIITVTGFVCGVIWLLATLFKRPHEKIAS